ncbi:uncharacterized protein [Bemisia tabaci]
MAQSTRGSLSEALHGLKVSERQRRKQLLEARSNPNVMANAAAVEYLDGLEELHFAYKKRREHFENVYRLIRINGPSQEPSDSMKKILRCIRDMELMWKFHDGLLLGQTCQDALSKTEKPLSDEPQLNQLLLTFATTAVQYYHTLNYFDEALRASPLACYLFSEDELNISEIK